MRFFIQLIRKWSQSFRFQPGLDVLLSRAPSESAELRERLNWLRQLVGWVRTTGSDTQSVESNSSSVETLRSRYIFQILDRNPEIKIKVAECLRSIIRDSRALELFVQTGASSQQGQQQGFLGEFLERIMLRILPQPPCDEDLITVFSETFRFESDAEWILEMDPTIFQGWVDLFYYSNGNIVLPWNTLLRDAKDALYLLGGSIQNRGLSRLIRARVNQPDFHQLPFDELTDCIGAILKESDFSVRIQDYERLVHTLERCFQTISEVNLHFRNHGASVNLVYQLECLKTQLKRCEILSKLVAGLDQRAHFVQEFLGVLVSESIRSRKLLGLLEDNFVLLCQRMIETNAETGEHYITRTTGEYFQILRKSCGGGALTAFTTLIKLWVTHLSVAPFISGILASLNYAVSFVTLQFLGFTLATKQPAMTATALAEKIDETKDSVEPLVDEVTHLIRSQLAAVIGNISTVVPGVLFLDWISSQLGSHLMDKAYGHHTMASLSVLGMTPIYAAWTGVLLWLSSVFSGWFGNWFHFRGLPEAIEHHPRLRYVFGVSKVKRFSELVNQHIAGLVANISLAFLLGMTPAFAAFLGFPLEVRHVTLSSGALAASVMALGPSCLLESEFWLAMGGIFSMGVFNVTVSFALALTVAIWAKKATSPKRSVIYRALLKKFFGQPWQFIFPPKGSREIAAHS